MEPTYTDEITKNVIFAMRKAGVKQGVLADELGITTQTLSKRLNDGNFTFGQLAVVAAVVATTVAALLPTEAAA